MSHAFPAQVHPLAAPHYVSGRPSLYLHLGMTGAVLEVPAETTAPPPPPPPGPWAFAAAAPPDAPSTADAGLRHAVAWREADLDEFCRAFDGLLEGAAYAHAWREGDVVVIDNLAVAHKAAPGAHDPSSGLRVLHRTTVLAARAHDPPAHLKLPHTLETGGPRPFPGAAWAAGYVGFRWGDYRARAVPH